MIQGIFSVQQQREPQEHLQKPPLEKPNQAVYFLIFFWLPDIPLQPEMTVGKSFLIQMHHCEFTSRNSIIDIKSSH